MPTNIFHSLLIRGKSVELARFLDAEFSSTSSPLLLGTRPQSDNPSAGMMWRPNSGVSARAVPRGINLNFWSDWEGHEFVSNLSSNHPSLLIDHLYGGELGAGGRISGRKVWTAKTLIENRSFKQKTHEDDWACSGWRPLENSIRFEDPIAGARAEALIGSTTYEGRCGKFSTISSYVEELKKQIKQADHMSMMLTKALVRASGSLCPFTPSKPRTRPAGNLWDNAPLPATSNFKLREGARLAVDMNKASILLKNGWAVHAHIEFPWRARIVVSAEAEAQNMPDGSAGSVEWEVDRETGVVFQSARAFCSSGLLWDPGRGRAAFEETNVRGEVTKALHFFSGRLVRPLAALPRPTKNQLRRFNERILSPR